jgi:2-amino-4-hydroxy-6-hydroxymethyldihydropteridine diphosphokinase
LSILPSAGAVGTGPRAFVGLGANLGDARRTIALALQALGSLPHTWLVSMSSLYLTAPVDAAGPDFINAVAELATGLDPPALLHALLAVEAQHGRTRAFAHAPRTLDLDLLAYGDTVMATNDLCLPHPRAHLRAFVLRPWAEIAPEFVLVGRGRIGELAATVQGETERLSS